MAPRDSLRPLRPAGSTTLFAPLPARLFPGTIREPDLLYIAPENAPGPDVEYPTHIDLALEIVSPGKDARQRDYEDKRATTPARGSLNTGLSILRRIRSLSLYFRAALMWTMASSNWRHRFRRTSARIEYRCPCDAQCIVAF